MVPHDSASILKLLGTCAWISQLFQVWPTLKKTGLVSQGVTEKPGEFSN